MELLIHVNKRVKCRNDVQLPVETLLQLYRDPTANSFIIVSMLNMFNIMM